MTEQPRTRLFPQFDADGYRRTIEFYEKSVKMYSDKLTQPGTTPEHRGSLAYNIFASRLHQFLARYSSGEEVSALKIDFPSLVQAHAAQKNEPKRYPIRFANLDNYSQSLWLVSLAILLDADEATWRTLLSSLGNEGEDALFERLVALREPRRVSSTLPLLHPKPYASLLAAIDAERPARSGLIASFLASWYKAMRSVYWHGNHTIKGPGFFGYWCIEAAAFAKKLAVDDSPFADNPYYPRDLVQGARRTRARYIGAYSDRTSPGEHQVCRLKSPQPASDEVCVIRVPVIDLAGRMLDCRYEILDAELDDNDAVVLISKAILVDLTNHYWRSEADDIGFTNLKSGAARTVPYPKSDIPSDGIPVEY